MRWLLDQGLPRSAAALLRQAGEDAVHVGELGLEKASDAEILQVASAQWRVVASLDADFHSLLAASGAAGPSVVRIREERLKGGTIALIIRAIGTEIDEALERGCVASSSGGQVRVRALPI